jgi:dipeptidyl aminopeptidase/acylaminoacyl peptidase
MPDRLIAPYGSWKSPITAELIAGGSVVLSQPCIEGGDIYWIEMRPAEAGRAVIVRRDTEGETLDINPMPFNARTRVHEYGGGDFTVHDRSVYFANFADQRLYLAAGGAEPDPLTAPAPWRYADPLFDSQRDRLICIQEDHSCGGKEPVSSLVTNSLVSVSLDWLGSQPLAAGNDFYSSPRLSPDGAKLAWLSWNHPNMPWDGTELWVGTFAENGLLSASERVAGGPDESIFQPEWSPDGTLYFVSDRTGWWNLHRLDSDGTIENLHAMDAEFGMPQWGFGMSTYAFESSERIFCTYIQNGVSRLATIDTRTKTLKSIECPYTDIRYVRAAPGQAVMRAASPTQTAAIVRYDFETEKFETLRQSNTTSFDAEYLSAPVAIEFPTAGGLTAYGFFYGPKNRDYRAPDDEKPPLLVMSHGGPTAAATSALSLSIQYWTSRGVAVLDVNYGGSTGYGRAYRERLKGQWGIVDVQDCAHGARYLVSHGKVDGERLMITGSSAGGYTTLCALTFDDTFAAGASHYGVSDVEALAKETHKFESRYLDGFMGAYPEQRKIYFERSPINFTERLSCPVIFFQGLDDKVVPPNQAETMVEALKTKGIPVAYLPFAGESHGFRQAKNIKRALEAELYFYSRVFAFDLAEPVEPVEIENLKRAKAS